MLEHPFKNLKQVVLLNECHLHIELVKLSGATVSSGILIAETWGYLEVTGETRNHQ